MNQRKKLPLFDCIKHGLTKDVLQYVDASGHAHHAFCALCVCDLLSTYLTPVTEIHDDGEPDLL
jgi:hypothetical protein